MSIVDMGLVFRSVKRIECLSDSSKSIGNSKIFFGGSMMNDPHDVKKFVGLTRVSLKNRGDKELVNAQQYFHNACKFCPIRDKCCVEEENKKLARENIFWELFGMSSEERRRYNNRLESIKKKYEKEVCSFTCKDIIHLDRL